MPDHVTLVNQTDIYTAVGVASNPLRVDPTGTTVQPVSGSIAVTGISGASTVGISGQPIGVSGSALTATIASLYLVHHPHQV